MDIPQLLSAINIKQQALQEAKDVYQKRLSPDFNAFSFVGLNENRISSVIAFLLDPAETHGQGAEFLALFLERLGIDWSKGFIENLKVKTEAPTDRMEVGNRRIDILVTARNFAFAVENKIWAGDLDNQLSHYADHLLKLQPRKHLLVYLTPDGRDPSKESIDPARLERMKSSKQFQPMSYVPDILVWIDDCKRVCQSDRISSFLGDFSRFMEINLKGVTDVNKEQIVQSATDGPRAVASALKIIMAGSDIKAALLTRLKNQLNDKLITTENISLDWHFYPGSEKEKYPSFAFRHQSFRNLRFQVQFEETNFNHLIYGISMAEGVSKSVVNVGAIRETLNTQVGHGKETETWPWYREVSQEELLPSERDWSASELPWVSIDEGVFANHAIEASKKIFQMLQNVKE